MIRDKYQFNKTETDFIHVLSLYLLIIYLFESVLLHSLNADRFINIEFYFNVKNIYDDVEVEFNVVF
jgi:hypothetical protein